MTWLYAGHIECHGQASPTATRSLRISAFGGVSGVYTGLALGKNLALTTGLDFDIRPLFHLLPSLEVRGSFPVNKGQVDNQRNLLGGVKLGKRYSRLTPYGDFLIGRGQIDYGGGRLSPDEQFVYIQSVSNVFSTGVGVDLDLSEKLAVKADAQFERYSTPVTASGHLFSKKLTAAFIYRFSFERHRSR